MRSASAAKLGFARRSAKAAREEEVWRKWRREREGMGRLRGECGG
jgi:hypothetical protein